MSENPKIRNNRLSLAKDGLRYHPLDLDYTFALVDVGIQLEAQQTDTFVMLHRNKRCLPTSTIYFFQPYKIETATATLDFKMTEVELKSNAASECAIDIPISDSSSEADGGSSKPPGFFSIYSVRMLFTFAVFQPVLTLLTK